MLVSPGPGWAACPPSPPQPGGTPSGTSLYSLCLGVNLTLGVGYIQGWSVPYLGWAGDPQKINGLLWSILSYYRGRLSCFCSFLVLSFPQVATDYPREAAY